MDMSNIEEKFEETPQAVEYRQYLCDCGAFDDFGNSVVHIYSAKFLH